MNIFNSKLQDEKLVSLVSELEKLLAYKCLTDFQVVQLSQTIDKRIVEVMREKVVSVKTH